MISRNRLALLLASASILAACATAPQVAQVAPPPPALAEAPPAPAEPAPVPQLISQVEIPHEQFQLANGLTVLVHTDRKAPVVGVAMWYNVGSKDEPKGRTGFAHLFEHLMFNGSETCRATSSNISSRSARPTTTARPLRPHQLFPDGAHWSPRARAVHGERPDGLSARRGHPGEAR